MSKEEYYSKIKRFVYRRFDELEVVERNDGNTLYFHYDNEQYAQIRINKKLGWVFYSNRFRGKINKIFRLEQIDFEILLKSWVEDTFKIKVLNTHSVDDALTLALKIHLK